MAKRNDDVIDAALLLLLAWLAWRAPGRSDVVIDWTNPDTGEVQPLPSGPTNGTGSHGDTGQMPPIDGEDWERPADDDWFDRLD